MPPAGYRKRETQRIKELISETLMLEASVSAITMEFIIRADPEIRRLLEKNKTELPSLETINNYVSKERTRIKSSGSDRPWSVLASSDPKKHDYIPTNDLPLILKIWSIRLAHGQQLTLRHARWISRLRPLVNLDESNDNELSNLFHIAARYASREATFGEKKNDLDGEAVDSRDLDGELFALFSPVKDDSERVAKHVGYEVAVARGLFTLPLRDRALSDEWLRETERTAQFMDEIRALSTKAPTHIDGLDLSSSGVLFLVFALLFNRARWKSETEDSRRSIVEKVVDAVVAKDWKSVSIFAGTHVAGLNDDFLEKLQIEENIDE